MADRLLDLGDSADALYVVDHYQRIARWNAGAERLLGYPGQEVLNRPCHEVIAGCGRDGKPICRADCSARKTAERGELPAATEMHVRTGDGRRVWLHLSIIVVPQEPGPLKLHLLQDVSDRKYAAEVMAEVASLCRAHRVLARGDDTEVCRGDSRSPACLAAFTYREREVVRLLAKGLSNGAIALSLGVSVHTVRNHVHHVLTKSRAHNRAEVVSLALRGGL